MTDAGEKLAQRFIEAGGNQHWESALKFCLAELERAAEIAEQLIGESGGVAAAIRRRKE